MAFKNTYTANAVLSDNTIISIIAEVNSDNTVMNITVMEKGYYSNSKKYSIKISCESDLKESISKEINSIAGNLLYKITFNF